MNKFIRSIPQAISMLAMAFGTLLLPSCAEEQYIDVQDDEAVEMVIKLGQKTRTANSGDSTVWIDGDELTVIHAPENGNTFWSSRFSWISDNAFSGKVNRLSSKNDWYVVYPYMEQNTSADQISLTLPVAQTQTGNNNKAHFAGSQFPMIGKKSGVSRTTDLSMQMQNVLSAAELKVTNTTDAPIIVKQVQFTAPSPIAGGFTVDMTADSPALTAATGATQTVTLTVDEGTEIAAGEYALFYMAVAPFEAPAGSSLVISTVAVHPSAPDVLLTDEYTITLDKATSFNSSSVKTVNVAFEEPVVTERTYKLVSSITDGGTYLIAGRETAQDRVGLYICAFPPVGNNNCEHIKLGTEYDQETIVSSEYTNYEVVLIASGSKWLVKVKNTGKYMYFSNGVISFTDDPTLALAAQSITTNNNYPACIKDNNNYEFYHSGSNACFMYSQNKGANNLRFYQLEDTRSPQTLVFSPESATYNLGTQSWVTSVPSLSGYSTPVTYSSSDTSVATVDETSGVVTPISKGTAIITATAAESSLYQSGSASYTLTVKNSTSTSGKFVRVTSTDEINTEGEYVIVYENGSTKKAFKPVLNSSKNAFSQSSENAIDVTITDDEIDAADVEDCRIKLTNEASDVPLKFALLVPEADGTDDYYFVVRYTEGAGTSFYASTDQTGYRSTFALDGSGVMTLTGSGGSYRFRYSATNSAFQASTSSSSNLYLFVRTDGKQSQKLSFNPTSVTCTLNGTFTRPTLSGVKTTVSYTSSKESVATVDKNSGVVTIKGAGTTTITATAAETDQYRLATASYTLLVTDSSSSTVYTKVMSNSDIEADGTYVIVYENGSSSKAFKPIVNGSTFTESAANAVSASVSNGILYGDADIDACQVVLEAADGSYYFMKVGGYYLYPSQNNIGAETSPTTSRSLAITVSNGKATIKRSQYTHYLTYNNYFLRGGSDTNNLALYKLTDGTGKQKQTLSFDQSTVSWVVGDDQAHKIGVSYDFPQTVKGQKTNVSYDAEPETVAKIENGKIKIIGIGTATITATAEDTEEYYGATASYSLRISEPVSGDFVELEGSPFNLENSKLTQFLDAASTAYNDNNVTSSSSSIVTTYAPSGSTLDVPNPVTIKWDAASSGQATITILDDDQATVVWTQTATSGSKSSDVYNLIPGKTYYCTVEDSSGYLLKGMFQTTGRRRMIKVSDTTTNTHARNCRDLGGMKTIDGKTIKYGMIYRGTNLDSTTDTEQDLMANYLGIGWDIDLRQSSEGSAHFASKYNVTYVMCNYSSSVSSDHLTNPTKVKKTIDAFFAAAAAGKASYFHCAIGADRTGYWGLLIEGLLGVSASDCSIDYEMTSFASGITQNSWGTIGTRTRGTGNFSAGLNFFNGYAGETLQKKITNFLVNDCNVKSEDIEAFKNNVLE